MHHQPVRAVGIGKATYAERVDELGFAVQEDGTLIGVDIDVVGVRRQPEVGHDGRVLLMVEAFVDLVEALSRLCSPQNLRQKRMRGQIAPLKG